MSKTIELNGRQYELTNKGLGCTFCDLVELEPIKFNGVSECVIKTEGKCLNLDNPGLNFKLKK
jgi:hypothetical protein